jgi:hypothetical protein
MFKHLIVTVIALAFGLISVSAAQNANTGKVVAIDGVKIQIAFDVEKPVWIKKAAVIKVSHEAGAVVDSAAKVTESAEKSITITIKEGTDVKIGDSLSLQKVKVMTGC